MKSMKMIEGLREESGQAMVIMTLFLGFALMGFFALAMDVGNLYREKRLVQTAADSGALAAAYGESASGGGSGAITAIAKAAATQNGLTVVTGTPVANQATVTAADGIAGTVSTTNYVKVTVTEQTPTFFMGWFGSSFGTIGVSATATASYQVAPVPNSCFTALSKVGITNSSMYPVKNADILVDGSSGIIAAGCGVCGNGASGSAVYASQGGKIKTDSVNSAGGSCGLYGSGDICSNQTGRIENIAGNGPPAAVSNAGCGADPLASQMPALPTESSPTLPWTPPDGSGKSYTINPGTYKNFNASNVDVLTLNPGLYIFTGTFISGGGTTIQGAGVTLLFEPSSTTSLEGYSYGGSCECGIQNNTTLNISAPTNATSTSQGINGVVIWDANSLTSNGVVTPDYFEFGGGSNSNISGTIYAPNTNMLIGNGTSTQTLSSSIIANTIQVVGGSTVTNNYVPPSGGGGGGGVPVPGGVYLAQ